MSPHARQFKAGFYLSFTVGLALMARPAFGDAMDKAPKVFFTPPPGASLPPGASPPVAAASASPSARPSAGPTTKPAGSAAPPNSPQPSPSPGGVFPHGGATAQPGKTPQPGPQGGPQGNEANQHGTLAGSPSPKATPTPLAFPNPSESARPGPGANLPETPSPSPSGSTKPKVKVAADTLTTNRQTGLTTFRGNVKVDYGPTTITSEELNVNQNEQTISTNTRFTLTQPDPKQPGQSQVVTGTGMVYNYQTQEATVNGANMSTPAEYPGQTVYIRAKVVKAFGQNHFEASDAVFSTCDEVLSEKVPHYHVESKYLQYFAGDRIVAWNNKVFINGRYVFWLPVWVIPLKQEQNGLNIGRTNVEGFFLRSGYNYALPPLNNGFWLNDGRLILNLFERKGVGVGFEHNARWGYDAATYAFFYGLATPDRGNFLPGGQSAGLDQAIQDKLVAGGEKLFGLYGGPFQDHQYGIEHKQRLFGATLGGRFEDHNIYDPLSENYRNNRQSIHGDLKDTFENLGNLSLDFSVDRTIQRGNAVQISQAGTGALAPSIADRARGSVGFKVINTQVQMTSQIDRSHQQSVTITPNATDPTTFDLKTQEGGTNSTVSDNLNVNSDWGPNTRSTLTVPHRITITEPAPLPTTIPGVPSPSPQPWDQQVEPQFELTHQLTNVGTLSVQGQKFLDLTQYPSTFTPQAQVTRLQSLNKFDRLPEITATSNQLLSQWQPFTVKLGYGRFFEYASFVQRYQQDTPKPTSLLDINWPGNYINRMSMENALSSKQIDIGFKSKVDFGGTGYRQYLYSTGDAQYSVDERVTLVTNYTDKVSTNFNYTNNLTPPTFKELTDQGATPDKFKFTNNSPFQQDKLSLSKQTRLTGSFEVHNDPFLTYAFRGGYDYQNKLYDNLSSEVSWRNRIFGIPFGLTLNGQYDIQEDTDAVTGTNLGSLKFEKKTLNLAGLPKIPTFGIAGQWLPVTGTFTLRSTEGTFGGAYGSDVIVPGWQLDNSLGYDFQKGQWQTLVNRLYITLGNNWRNHVQLVLGGYYDTTIGPAGEDLRGYKFSTIGINKDLHDFVLSFQYDRLASFYSLSLTMVAFPSQPLSFTSNTFNRRTDAGGSAILGQ